MVTRGDRGDVLLKWINVYRVLVYVADDGADDVIGDGAPGAEPMQVVALGGTLGRAEAAGAPGVVKHILLYGRAAPTLMAS